MAKSNLVVPFVCIPFHQLAPCTDFVFTSGTAYFSRSPSSGTSIIASDDTNMTTVKAVCRRPISRGPRLGSRIYHTRYKQSMQG